MSVEPVTLNIPKEIYERAQERAESTQRPVEEVFLQELQTAFLPQLPPNEEAELASLKNLSDDALWTIAREQMAESLQARMQILMDKNSLGTITPDEFGELEKLVDRGQRLMLRKSEAAALLTERGFTVTHEELSVRD